MNTPPPLTPHFYIVKLGFTGVYMFFLFLLFNIDCGYSLEPPAIMLVSEFFEYLGSGLKVPTEINGFLLYADFMLSLCYYASERNL